MNNIKSVLTKEDIESFSFELFKIDSDIKVFNFKKESGKQDCYYGLIWEMNSQRVNIFIYNKNDDSFSESLFIGLVKDKEELRDIINSITQKKYIKKREVKFRLYSLDMNQMFPNEVIIMWKMFHLHIEKEGSYFMQFTGLFDKNGKEIYEGDIISYTEHKGYLMNSFIGEVVWLDNHSAFGYKIGLNEYPFNFIDEMQNDLLNHTEVIGNIYQNSKLIKNG